MEYKKIFLDTCVLSDIGKMNKEDRLNLSYKFIAEYNFQLILTSYNLIELEECPDINLKNNIYEFLDSCYLGYACDYGEVSFKEIQNDNVNIVKFPLFSLMENMLNFIEFKEQLFNYPEFINEKDKHRKILIEMQKLDEPNIVDKDYIDALIVNRIIKSSNIDKINLKINYNRIPALYTFSYSYVHKMRSSDFRDNYNEFGDVSMSYIAPYMDIVIAEKKQVARYNELKASKVFNGLNSVIIKKHSEVIKEINGKIKFNI